MSAKEVLRGLVPERLWRNLRLRRIIRSHERVACICDSLVKDCMSHDDGIRAVPMAKLDTDKVIWQYWAQGFENAPPIVRECADSVDRFKGCFRVIRLTDDNYVEYIRFPDSVSSKIRLMSKAHFSDMLRVALLSLYGGVWMDATIKLSGEIPAEYLDMDYFVFQRDPGEQFKDYWENAYAYYYGWAKGFRVNMLNSFIVAKKGNPVISLLSCALIKWWQNNDSIPDYFFFQILYDVIINGYLHDCKCRIVSDCPPHYLQQYINDPSFILRDKVPSMDFSTIHKMTYK